MVITFYGCRGGGGQGVHESKSMMVAYKKRSLKIDSSVLISSARKCHVNHPEDHFKIELD